MRCCADDEGFVALRRRPAGEVHISMLMPSSRFTTPRLLGTETSRGLGQTQTKPRRFGRFGVAGVDRLLEGLTGTSHPPLLGKQHPKVERRPGSLVGVAGVDRLLEGLTGTSHLPLL